MAVLDSSVIIGYLDGDETIIDIVDDTPPPHLTSAICLYEVLAGEVYSPGESDLEATRKAIDRIEIVGFDESISFEAARLQSRLLDTGEPMSPRDLFVAATARAVGEPLLVSDRDFDTEGLSEAVSVKWVE